MVDQSKDVRTRRAISNSQRRALRKWFYDPADGAESTKTHADASAWWQREYNYVLNSSTVSEILSYKYDPLDGRNTSGAGPDPSYRQTDERKRQRAPKWGLLEEELMQWMFWYESMAGEGSVTGKMLKERAAEIWKATPSYQDLPTPKWSEGWRSRFKVRYALRRQVLLEDQSVGISSICDSSSRGEDST